MKKMLLTLAIIGSSALLTFAQKDKPKVVIGIVIDQMRADYLTVFDKHYRRGGFNKLKKRGAWFKNCYINYLPAYTGPGHASIYTGSVPAIHGIAGNDWYDRKIEKSVYCVQDDAQRAIGGSPALGNKSPQNLQVTTVADELRLSSNNFSRTFAVSLKDRGAVLPVGHTANAAYWMDDSLGHFMTSTFYRNSLPEWVHNFNQNEPAKKYLLGGWQLLKKAGEYTYAARDSNRYESKLGDEQSNNFPYAFNNQKGSYIKRTPMGNSILFDFTKALVKNEKIGQQGYTDFLAISFSATDYVGHYFGPNSLEVEDMYIRFDRELAKLIDFFDDQYGKENYLLFLTADHGAAHNPTYLKDKNIPAGYFFASKEKVALNEMLQKKFGKKDLCKAIENGQVYLDMNKVSDKEKKKLEIVTLDYFKNHEAVFASCALDKIYQASLPQMIKDYLINSYYPARSGQIAFVLKPGYLDAYSATGTSHGVWSAYDTKIPLIFYGWNIFRRELNDQVYMTDIAPTIANMLGISPPNGSIGKALLPFDE